MDKLQWSALEYTEKERDPDWFWALGIIVVTSSIAAIIYENYFFAALIILSGLLLGFFAKKKPDLVDYELNILGLRIGSTLFPYENIKSFWIEESHPDAPHFKDVLFIKSERFFMPVFSIPIEASIAPDIKEIMFSKNIPEEEMRTHISEHIMDLLGF